MGSDDLFKKQKKKREARKSSDLKRKGASRKSMQKILIVCEGEKTEPLYFQEMISFYKLASVKSIVVTGDCGSSPKSVVEYAKQEDKKAISSGSPFDLIYCVFDKDAHTDYGTALEQTRQLGLKGRFHAITSIPCFEYWFLLHFTSSRRAFANTHASSSGEQMVKELRNYIPDYQKKKRGLFAVLHDKLEVAFDNSSKVRAAAEKDGTDDPSTLVDVLIKELIKVKSDFRG